jgi:hypothetical protein
MPRAEKRLIVGVSHPTIHRTGFAGRPISAYSGVNSRSNLSQGSFFSKMRKGPWDSTVPANPGERKRLVFGEADSLKTLQYFVFPVNSAC